MRRFLQVWGALLLLAVLAACNPAIRVPYQRPAKINLRGVNQIAIGGIYGQGGDVLYTDLGQAIFNSNRFQLVDRQNTERLLAEIAFQNSGFVSESQTAQVGKLFGAGALIFINISNYTAADRVEKTNSYTDSNGVAHTDWRRTSWGVVEAGFQVIDCETGRVLAIENLKGYYEEYLTATDQQPGYSDPNNLLSRARADIVGQFIRVIAPYEDYALIKFAKDRDIPQFEAGIRAIQTGNWGEGIRQFEAAYAAYPSDPRAMYNLGVAYEYTWQFDRALPLLEKAYQTKAKGVYLREIDNCKRLAAERAALEAQTGNK